MKNQILFTRRYSVSGSLSSDVVLRFCVVFSGLMMILRQKNKYITINQLSTI